MTAPRQLISAQRNHRVSLRRAKSFDDFGLHITYPAILNTGGGPSQSVRLTFVTAEMFETLGASPIIGRNFKPEEDIVGGDVLKAVLSYSLWQTTLGGNRNVAGRVIRLRGASYTVIGVMPPGFRFPIWVPLQARYAGYKAEFWKGRDFRPHTAVARLKPGVSLAQAQSEMNTLAAYLESEFPSPNAFLKAEILTLRLFSSTIASGQTALSSSSFSRMAPWRRTRTRSRSKTFGDSWIGSSSRSSRRSARSRRKGPNSYCFKTGFMNIATTPNWF